jgi:hypothetical protein
LEKVEFTHNIARNLGGGLSNAESATLRDVTFSRNVARRNDHAGFPAHGGAIVNFGDLSIRRALLAEMMAVGSTIAMVMWH